MVTKGPFMEIMRGETTSTGITVATNEFNTPVSRSEKLAMMIHFIRLRAPKAQFLAGLDAAYETAITSESHEGESEVPHLNDPDVLHAVKNYAAEGIVVGAFDRSQDDPQVVYFDPPMLYTKSKIYCEIRENAAGLGPLPAEFQIGYTLDKVPDADFIAALVE